MRVISKAKIAMSIMFVEFGNIGYFIWYVISLVLVLFDMVTLPMVDTADIVIHIYMRNA